MASKYKIFTSTDSMAAAKAKAHREGYVVRNSRTEQFCNGAGYVVYGQKSKKKSKVIVKSKKHLLSCPNVKSRR